MLDGRTIILLKCLTVMHLRRIPTSVLSFKSFFYFTLFHIILAISLPPPVWCYERKYKCEASDVFRANDTLFCLINLMNLLIIYETSFRFLYLFSFSFICGRVCLSSFTDLHIASMSVDRHKPFVNYDFEFIVFNT